MKQVPMKHLDSEQLTEAYYGDIDASEHLAEPQVSAKSGPSIGLADRAVKNLVWWVPQTRRPPHLFLSLQHDIVPPDISARPDISEGRDWSAVSRKAGISWAVQQAPSSAKGTALLSR